MSTKILTEEKQIVKEKLMGKKVVLSGPLVMLVLEAKKGQPKRIFSFPREALLKEIENYIERSVCIRISPNVNIPDELGRQQLRIAPWDSRPTFQSKYDYAENELIDLIEVNQSKVEKSFPFRLKKTDVSPEFLIHFLEAYCWITGKYKCECLIVGDSIDFNYQIREKKLILLTGDALIHFRYSEFKELVFKASCEFELLTSHSQYSGRMY